MKDGIRVGIVGAGLLGAHHAETCAANEAAEVVGVADLRADAAQELAGKVGAQPYGSARELFEAERVDFAVIATPDPLHKDPFLAAVAAGVRTILCEKPLATTVADAEQMLAAADKAGARVFVNYSNRFAWLFMATHRVLQQGLIGEPVYGESRLDDNISVPQRLWQARSREWAAGSSTAHFLLTHVVDLLHWFLAPARVEAVYAVKQERVLGFTPDLYDGFLFWDNGIKTRVKAEWVKHIETLVEFYLCIGGRAGSVVAHRRPGYGTSEGWRAMLAADRPKDVVASCAQGLTVQGVPVTGRMIQDPTCDGERQRGCLELKEQGERVDDDLFLQAIVEDTDSPSNWQGFGPLPGAEDGLRAVRVIEAFTDSAQKGERVGVPSR